MHMCGCGGGGGGGGGGRWMKMSMYGEGRKGDISLTVILQWCCVPLLRELHRPTSREHVSYLLLGNGLVHVSLDSVRLDKKLLYMTEVTAGPNLAIHACTVYII